MIISLTRLATLTRMDRLAWLTMVSRRAISHWRPRMGRLTSLALLTITLRATRPTRQTGMTGNSLRIRQGRLYRPPIRPN